MSEVVVSVVSDTGLVEALSQSATGHDCSLFGGGSEWCRCSGIGTAADNEELGVLAAAVAGRVSSDIEWGGLIVVDRVDVDVAGQ